MNEDVKDLPNEQLLDEITLLKTEFAEKIAPPLSSLLEKYVLVTRRIESIEKELEARGVEV